MITIEVQGFMQVNQLDLFQKIIDDPVLNQIQDLKEKQNKLRRGLFQKYDLLQKEIDELRGRLDRVCSIHHIEFQDQDSYILS